MPTSTEATTDDVPISPRESSVDPPEDTPAAADVTKPEASDVTMSPAAAEPEEKLNEAKLDDVAVATPTQATPATPKTSESGRKSKKTSSASASKSKKGNAQARDVKVHLTSSFK